MRHERRHAAGRLAGALAIALAGTGCAAMPDDLIASAGRTESKEVALDARPYDMRVVASGLAAPWAISWGPDDHLWLTERVGKRVVRLDPRSGARKTALRVDEVHQSSGQDGLLGMALHRDLLMGKGSDYVYLAYTYDADASEALARRVRIVRYTYDAQREALIAPRVLLSGLPGSNDHNAGRLVFGPDDKLYYAIGDQGNNQFDRKCMENHAQALPTGAEIRQGDLTKYQGKILRVDLDGAIPRDNPLLNGARSHIYTHGHRNTQGLAFSASGLLYASEHGPKTDDELDLIVPGMNYGWPHVAGFQDDRGYEYGNWSASPSCASLEYSAYVLPASVPVTRERDFDAFAFLPPLSTFYTVEDDHDFEDAACRQTENLCWPTIAPSSLAFYAAGHEGIAAWDNALLVPSLKKGSLYLVRLSADGRRVLDGVTPLFKTNNRYRDLTVGPDRRTFYVITDAQGDTSGPTRGSTTKLAHPGAILAFHVRD